MGGTLNSDGPTDKILQWVTAFTGIDTHSAGPSVALTPDQAPGGGGAGLDSDTVGFLPSAGLAGGFTDLRGDSSDPAKVAAWIEANVPCFTGPIPEKWTKTVRTEAGKRGISDRVLDAALALARKQGFDFVDTSVRLDIEPPNGMPSGNDGPRMGPVDADYVRKSRIATARILESKYEVAMHSGNIEEMKKIAKAFADMLNAAAENLEPLGEEEMQHGAPLLRRAIIWNASAPQGGRGGAGGGPYRVSPTLEVELEEEETEAE